MVKCDKISIETKVSMININYEEGADILKGCKTLGEYSRFIYMIREKQKDMPVDDAVKKTVEECMESGILEAFLKENGGDLMDFVNLELTREECEAIREEDGYVRGLEEGRNEEQIEIARRMKKMGAEIGFISRASGLSEDEVKAL